VSPGRASESEAAASAKCARQSVTGSELKDPELPQCAHALQTHSIPRPQLAFASLLSSLILPSEWQLAYLSSEPGSGALLLGP